MNQQQENDPLVALPARLAREVSVDLHENLMGSAIDFGNIEVLADSHRRLQKLYELSQDICAAMGRDNVLNTASEAVVQLCGAERCFILTGASFGELEMAVACPAREFSKDTDWSISRTILGRVFESGKSLLTCDALYDLRSIPSVIAHRIRSVLCVQVGPSGSPVGVVYADNRAEKAIFDELDLRFLVALSQFVYLALRNAHELERKNRQIELSDARWETYQNELFGQHQIIGRSQLMLKAYERLRLAAMKNVPILLVGESGTGKELFAAAAHQLSSRSNKPYIAVNVAAFSSDLITSELFGHVKGAFTGAMKDRQGRLELADGGTLFLDEVGEIPAHAQVALLRALENGEFERVGSGDKCHADVRLICATNRNLRALAESGAFRSDLYYRIAGVTIELPPLRQRRDDIPELLEHMLKKIGSEKRFDESATEKLKNYYWPGNVRQLYRVVEELDAVCHRMVISETDLPSYIREEPEAEELDALPTLAERVQKVTCEHFRWAYELAEEDDQRAMAILGLKRTKYFAVKRECLTRPAT
jgi:two-component system NtrC family response regulator